MNKMLSWQIGDVKITRIVELEMEVPAQVIPEATPEELRKSPWLFPHFAGADAATLKFNIQAMLVEAPGLRLIVDTCIGNDRPRRIAGNIPLATPFLQYLEQAGCPRESVNAVLCTHLHADHAGWNTMLENGKWVPAFPNARYLIGRLEYDFWSATEDEEQREMLGDSIQPIFDAGLVQLVELDHVISPQVRLTPSIGHTPGHVSVMIESAGARAVITGDMAHHPCQLAHPDWMIGDTDKETGARTRRRLFAEWADAPILVIGTHFAGPTAGHIVRDGTVFKFAV